MRHAFLPLALTGTLLFAAAARAQEHQHTHGELEGLGKVNFPTTCSGVDAEFTRAVALLHSFGYEEARRAFEEVAAKDPACGMAYWGIAMTWYHPIWAPPNPRELAAGAAAAKKAAALCRKDRPGARLHRRDRRLLRGLGPLDPPGPGEGLQRRDRRSSRGSSPTITRRRSSTPCR